MQQRSVRVVIPCFNHGPWVREAVDSALALEDATVEVVVVDDGSDDGTSPAACDACAGPRVAVVHRSNGGLSAARNTGAAGAATDYLAFLDADDLLLPHFARDLAAAIEAERGAGRDDVSHAYGFEQVTGIHELVWKCPPWDPIRELITNLHPVTALVRRDVFEQAGGFDESLRRGHEDWEFWIRCVGLGYRGVRIEKPTFVWRRIHERSLLYTALDAYSENVHAILTRHADVYRAHALPVIERALGMLHDADATWLDEDYGAIHVRNRAAWIAEVVAERDARAAEVAAAEARLREALGAVTASAAELDRVRDAYEANPAIRLSRAIHGFIESLPAPISGPLRRILAAASARARRR